MSYAGTSAEIEGNRPWKIHTKSPQKYLKLKTQDSLAHTHTAIMSDTIFLKKKQCIYPK